MPLYVSVQASAYFEASSQCVNASLRPKDLVGVAPTEELLLKNLLFHGADLLLEYYIRAATAASVRVSLLLMYGSTSTLGSSSYCGQ